MKMELSISSILGHRLGWPHQSPPNVLVGPSKMEGHDGVVWVATSYPSSSHFNELSVEIILSLTLYLIQRRGREGRRGIILIEGRGRDIILFGLIGGEIK